jgi:hypothetical protein
MVSLRFPPEERLVNAANVDTSLLIALVSLVADTRNGERVPVEAGLLTGQKLFDSVHPIPEEYVEDMKRNDPCRVALGYFTFPGLLVRQSGTYRLRTSLLQIPTSGGGGSTLMSVDSTPIKVERRQVLSGRGQRMYS